MCVLGIAMAERAHILPQEHIFPQTLLTRMRQMTQIAAHRICCCGRNIQIHTDYRNPVEEKGLHGHSRERL